MDVNTLLLLRDVMKAGSLAQAARETGVPKSTISRKLRALEEDVGARLLQRTTRKIGLTDAGRRLLEHADAVAAAVDRATEDVRAAGMAPAGVLRVTASVSLGERFLRPALVEFVRQHPSVSLEVVLDPARNDLIAEEIDVAIRVGRLDPQSSLIARRLGKALLHLCASPEYLDVRGHPETLDDLRALDGVVYQPGRDAPAFVLEDEDGEVHRVRLEPRLTANSHIVARAGALAGLGVALLPASFCSEDLKEGRLVRVMPRYRAPEMWIYAAFPNRQLSAAARAFVDFMTEHVDPSEFFDTD